MRLCLYESETDIAVGRACHYDRIIILRQQALRMP